MSAWKKSAVWVLAVALAGGLVFGVVAPARAAEFRSGGTVVIGPDEVIDDDLFVSAGRVEVNGTVTGDLIAAGSTVIVNGRVGGSLAMGGQLLTMNGTVGGSVYAGGYALTLGPDAEIGRNLAFGGFSLSTEDGSAVGRGLYAGNYQSILRGDVAGEARVAAGALELDGKVGGDVSAQVDAPGGDVSGFAPVAAMMPGGVEVMPPGLRVGPGAEIGGDLSYVSPMEQAPPAGAVGGQVVYSTPVPGQAPAERPGAAARLGGAFAERAGEFVALLIVGGLLLRFWPGIVRRVTGMIDARPLPSAGWGCLVTLIFAVGVPLAAIALFLLALLGGVVTFGQLFGTVLALGGAALGLAVTVFLFVVSLVTKAIVAFYGGRLILTRLVPQSQTGRWADLWSLLTGALVYELLRALPLGLGWLIGVIVTLVGLGAIYFVVRDAFRPAPVPAR